MLLDCGFHVIRLWFSALNNEFDHRNDASQQIFSKTLIEFNLLTSLIITEFLAWYLNTKNKPMA